MNIIYLYHNYYKRRALYADIMRKLGHNVYAIDVGNKMHSKKKDHLPIKLIKKIKPDIIWLLSPFYIANGIISEEKIQYLKDNNIFISVYGCFDVETPYTEWIDSVWKKIDFLFLDSLICARDLKKRGIDAHFVPLGFHTGQYYYFRGNCKKKIDFSFMGSSQKTSKYQKRIKYINKLHEELPDLNIKVYGNSFKGHLLTGIKCHSFNCHAHQRQVYARSKISLDLPFVNTSCPFYKDMLTIKNKFFELPATGNFMLTVKSEESLRFFSDKEIGYCDDNIESMKDKIKYYLNHTVEREKMAERAYCIAHKHHTYTHRFIEMFSIINKGTR